MTIDTQKSLLIRYPFLSLNVFSKVSSYACGPKETEDRLLDAPME